MRTIRQLRSAAQFYQERGFRDLMILVREKIARQRRVNPITIANAATGVALLSDVINSRGEFGDIAIEQADIETCRKDILVRYLRLGFSDAADQYAKNVQHLTPLDTLLYIDCLYRLWSFARITQLADLIRTRLAGTRFASRGEQIVRRALLRVGRLQEASDGLDTGDWASADIGELLLRADIWDATGRMELSTDAYERAIRRHSDNPMTRLHYAFHLLKKGEVLDGLANWGVADRILGAYPMRANGPLWRGEALDGKRLFIIFEHGLGDMIQFSRFIVLLRERWPTAQVIGCVPAVLTGLLNQSLPGVEFLSDQDEDPPYDFYVPSIQLPVVLEAPSLEPTKGYIKLSQPAARVGADRDRFKMRVGICWRGFPRHYEHVRSIPLETFSVLFSNEDIEFVCLLNKVTEQELMLLQSFRNVSIPDINDFVELSGIMAACDLVVSVDTAVVHLAAGSGMPVLLLCRPDSCWRWGPSGTTSPWYPTVTTIRHPGDLNWQAVLGEAAGRLDDRLAGLRPERSQERGDGPLPEPESLRPRTLDPRMQPAALQAVDAVGGGARMMRSLSDPLTSSERPRRAQRAKGQS